ncbi:uncharacterized protein LY89DRAFT_263953 [Mollisia scopiformis]|uniref:Uncharacterized protein n=1 Tax=Mollisia scopiformis TaxID=149040 RepID=A0A132BE86_MOLSC|nr:uncharacterized protein LY89DRAFT_263953 [Mollisia scopiformis]KUJ10563.1 hypothetical protein LY89DRAFT_263953 [Mollisia scopiformis]
MMMMEGHNAWRGNDRIISTKSRLRFTTIWASSTVSSMRTRARKDAVRMPHLLGRFRDHASFLSPSNKVTLGLAMLLLLTRRSHRIIDSLSQQRRLLDVRSLKKSMAILIYPPRSYLFLLIHPVPRLLASP